MTLILGKIPQSDTMIGQAREVALQHHEMDGTGGHSARGELRNCEHPVCAAFRESISGPKTLRVAK